MPNVVDSEPCTSYTVAVPRVWRVTVGQTQFKMPSTTVFLAASAAVSYAFAQTVPESAQIVDQKSFNVLPNVPPPSGANASTVCFPSRAAPSDLGYLTVL
jgi:hypothetical protein